MTKCIKIKTEDYVNFMETSTGVLTPAVPDRLRRRSAAILGHFRFLDSGSSIANPAAGKLLRYVAK